MTNKLLKLKSNIGFKKYFFNTSWLFIEQSLRILSGLFVGVWVARYLGPEQFGIFSYALAFSSIFAGIARLGLDGIIVRELVRHPANRNVYLGTAFWLKVIGAFLVIGLICIIIQFTSNDYITNIYIMIISSGLIFQSFEVVDFYFQSQVQAKIVTLCKVSLLILSSSIKISLVVLEVELIWFVFITTFDSIALAISYIIAYRVKGNPIFYKFFNLNIAKNLLKDSWPLIFSSIVVMIYMRIDQVMIKAMLGEHEVGIYSAAVRLGEAFYFIPVLISSSLFPAVLNAKNQNEELYKHRLQRLFTLMVWLAVAISIPMTFLSDFFVLKLFGNLYNEAGKVLIIHIWSSIFVFLGVASGKWFIIENLQMLSFWRTFIGMVINIFFNFLLIPRFGLQGAAFSTLIGQFVATYLFDIFTKETRLIFIMKTKSLLCFSLILDNK